MSLLPHGRGSVAVPLPSDKTLENRHNPRFPRAGPGDFRC